MMSSEFSNNIPNTKEISIEGFFTYLRYEFEDLNSELNEKNNRKTDVEILPCFVNTSENRIREVKNKVIEKFNKTKKCDQKTILAMLKTREYSSSASRILSRQWTPIATIIGLYIAVIEGISNNFKDSVLLTIAFIILAVVTLSVVLMIITCKSIKEEVKFIREENFYKLCFEWLKTIES